METPGRVTRRKLKAVRRGKIRSGHIFDVLQAVYFVAGLGLANDDGLAAFAPL